MVVNSKSTEKLLFKAVCVVLLVLYYNVFVCGGVGGKKKPRTMGGCSGWGGLGFFV